MKALVLAEKPSVAREIARVLNCQSKNKGYIEGPKYIVTWALGHLVTLCEPHDYDEKYKQWRLEDLPMLPDRMKLKTIRQVNHQYRVVKSLMIRKDVNELIIATDAGREGELVARWIIDKANCKKPIKRLWISSQTDAAIKEGFARLKPGSEYNNLYQAAVCRAEADWLIGLNVTRALACKHNAQLTAGRVQTPTLAMIVNREKEIQEFKPVDYWTLRADFGEYFGDWRDKKGQGRIFDEAKARELASRLQGQDGVITSLNISSKSEAPPLAYDLTELQRDANRRLNFSAQKTLSVLQDLYEQHKLVSYPRTDSRYISSDIVPTLPARLKAMGVGPYADFAGALLKKKLNPGKRLVDNSKVSDHHAIIPTEQPLNLGKLNTDEKKLYDLIARRFLAVLYPPHLYEQVTIITTVNSEAFHSRGKRTKEMGWKAVTTVIAEKENDSAQEIPLQNLTSQQQGEGKQVKSLKTNKARTTPPPRFTEATLLTAMESPGKYIEDEELRETIKGRGLGTPATRAEIIEKLINSFYVERRGKSLVPTDKGIQLIALAPDSLRSPEMTAEWEQRLNDIAVGKGNRSEFIRGIRESAVEMVQKVIADDATFKATNVSRSKCPSCGKNMLLVNGKKGKMLICPDRSCGHRQPEKPQNTDIFSRGKGSSRYDQKLIARYSDKEEIGTNLGDLLKEAMAKKEKEK
ncbi:MAG: DNA topoisomerase III [Syntrophomonadaceae bacterium]|jgi:DNA topoisomerase-3|nr:DNA topoisomerase III [Syntrophomonadaceae bacterium]